ncbi:unnamed protein product [Amoebophrya sp. A25]|nr:unnamed protein product [Amoebophrya sp. A25]|eukprot:GSA25T00001861001.1
MFAVYLLNVHSLGYLAPSETFKVLHEARAPSLRRMATGLGLLSYFCLRARSRRKQGRKIPRRSYILFTGGARRFRV